jgi:hypothetical protein
MVVPKATAEPMSTARSPLTSPGLASRLTSNGVGGSVRGLYTAGRVVVDEAERLDAAITIACFANPKLQFLFRYWQTRRLGRAMPRRADIDVLDLGSCLGHLVVIDVGEEGTSLTYRLFGTRISSHLGFDPTGHDLMELPRDAEDHLGLPYRMAVEHRAPVYCINRMSRPGRSSRWERLILPLSLDGASVSQLLIGGFPLDTAPSISR